jgi:hypothetical protein
MQLIFLDSMLIGIRRELAGSFPLQSLLDAGSGNRWQLCNRR